MTGLTLTQSAERGAAQRSLGELDRVELPPLEREAPTRSDRLALEEEQLIKLRRLLASLLSANPFYTRKLASTGLTGKVSSLAEFVQRMPFTTKPELIADQKTYPPYGSNLTYPLGAYSRCHQTSGSAGLPLRWLDTPDDWNRLVDNWEQILKVAEVNCADRLFFAFSFGPFLGFWTAFEAALRMKCFCFPGGSMSSVARLRAILDNAITVLCCTPTYAMRLGEAARDEKLDLREGKVRLIIVAGEAGGSIPATRKRISALWNGARVFDHHGMTEVGPVTYECPAQPGTLHVIESAYLPEVVHPETGQPVNPDQAGELVLTTLERTGSPLLRYRTGDLVKSVPLSPCACGRHELAFEGGILGRSDDMVVVRGVNIYPSAVEDLVRNFPEVAEYQVILQRQKAMLELRLAVEPVIDHPDPADLACRLERTFQSAFNLRVQVTCMPAGSLPRFEMKAKRWVKPPEN